MAKILIVEDNEMNLDMLSRRLARKGYQVITAMDGAEGLQMANYELPNLILMDMSLPGMDGWEATRHLKASPETKYIPVIALTAHAMVGDKERCLEAGMDDYISKPIRREELVELLKRYSPVPTTESVI